MNIAIIQGRPTASPELKKGRRTGTVFCTFTVACERPYKGKDVPRETDFFNVVVFGKQAQAIYNNLAKGALCTVFGRLEQDKWETPAGDRRTLVQIKAEKVTIHEWLRKHRPIDDIDADFDLMIPRDLTTNSLYKQIDIDDEDIPDDLAGEPIGGDFGDYI